MLVIVLVPTAAVVAGAPGSFCVNTVSVGLPTPPPPIPVVSVTTPSPPAVTTALYVGNANPVPGGYLVVSLPSQHPQGAVLVIVQPAVVGLSSGESEHVQAVVTPPEGTLSSV